MTARGSHCAVGLALIVLIACTTGGEHKSGQSSPQIGDRELAVPGRSVPATTVTVVTTSLTTAANPAGASSAETTSTANSTSLHELRRIADVADSNADAGVQAPAYADALEITVDDDGVNARVTVRLRATVPSTLGDGEVMGIGVNLAPPDGAAAQVFADGEQDGWYAYLQVDDHLVTYTGTFDLSGDSLVFMVPWNVIGDMTSGVVDGFVDWSKPLVGSQAVSTSDRVPDAGNAPFRR